MPSKLALSSAVGGGEATTGSCRAIQDAASSEAERRRYTSLIDSPVDKAIRPEGPGYEQVRHTYALAGSPAAVFAVEQADEVPAALRFATEQRLPLSIRSGGHGPSTNDGGVVVDLGRLSELEVLDAAQGRVRVGAGARWSEVAQELGRHRLALTSGDYGGVGVGGIATVGGVGLLARRQGLTIDRVRAVEMYLADGTFLRADDSEHADLFWAMRGAGGAFGVATAFEFEAEEIDRVVSGAFVHQPGDLAALIGRWAELVEQAPRELTSFFYVIPSPVNGQPLVRATAVDAGADEEAGRDAVAPFAELLPGDEQQITVGPYADLLPPSQEPHQAQAAVFAGRSGLLDRISRENAAAMAALVDSKAALILQLRSVGGAVNDVVADATAYAHRHQGFSVVGVGPRERLAELDAAWNAGLGSSLDGTYLNLETERGQDDSVVRRAYPPPTLTRLRDLKRRYDPDGVFDLSLKIPPA
jgi:FAD/FMN-containing dehydrogenase